MKTEITRVEFDWTIKQLLGIGYIASGPEDTITLTDSGIDAALTLEYQIGVPGRLLLMLLNYSRYQGALDSELEEVKQ